MLSLDSSHICPPTKRAIKNEASFLHLKLVRVLSSSVVSMNGAGIMQLIQQGGHLVWVGATNNAEWQPQPGCSKVAGPCLVRHEHEMHLRKALLIETAQTHNGGSKGIERYYFSFFALSQTLLLSCTFARF